MYAIIETGGKQLKVSPGEVIVTEKLAVEADDIVEFDKVLLVKTDSGLTVGSPYVDGAKVQATVVEHGRGKKIIVFKYKPKKDYRKKQGHRQPYTKLEITGIEVE